MRETWLVGCFAVLICAPGAQAHNAWGVLSADIDREVVITRDQFIDVLNKQTDQNARWVLERSLLWKPGARLRGCFMDGSEAQKAKVAQATASLLRPEKQINITVNFGTPFNACSGSEEVRVSFSECCAAYIGRTALHPKLTGKPTVFLGGAGDSTIQHEILHVLGFHHEHQKPGTPCEIDLEALAQLPRFRSWTSAMIQQNFAELDVSSRKYASSPVFDSESLLKYYIEPQVLKGGERSACFSLPASAPSQGDYSGLQDAYPMTADQQSVRQRALGASLVLEGAPGALVDLIKSFREDPDR